MKLSRQEAIKNIIATQHIETQTDLAEALRDAGFNVTQATVSRDIKDMMLIKVPDDNGRYKYGFPTDNGEILTRERLEDTLRRYILTINSSENLIVIHTQPGSLFPGPPELGGPAGYRRRGRYRPFDCGRQRKCGSREKTADAEKGLIPC